jgi:nucleoside-diphosphate-sugar epimerase
MMRGDPIRLLIIGSRGFTGRHLVAVLRANPGIAVAEACDYGMDLRLPNTIAQTLDATRPELVINLGGVSAIITNDVRGLYDINAFGQLNLLQCLAARGFAGRLVFASSANIYGNNTRGTISEDQFPDPVNYYAISKLLAENFCRMFADHCDIVVVRPFNCIGAGQGSNFLLPKIVRHFREKQPSIELGNLDVERDFVDVRDAARAYELILTSAQSLTPIHIASGRAEPIRGIIQMLEELTGHRITVRINPAFVRPNDLHHQQADISRLQSLGFAPRYSIRDTLAWMLQAAIPNGEAVADRAALALAETR